MILIYFLLVLCFLSALGTGSEIEQFHVDGPSDLHQLAIDSFLEIRRKNPEEDLGEDSLIMKRAKLHAARRFSMKTDNMHPTNVASAVTETNSNNAEKSLTDITQSTSINSKAFAIQMHESIGQGAISKAGALPYGNEGQFLKFVEEKLKRDGSLDHQELMWELGTEILENRFMNESATNITHEKILYNNLDLWFKQRGGQLHFIERAGDVKNVDERSTITQSSHTFIATEEIQENEVILSIPLSLTICRITSRNVVISNRGRYLGEELKKTFEKSEVWGLVIFLLHEWYKETNGSGSKWGPFLKTLRCNLFSTTVLQSLSGSQMINQLSKWNKDIKKLRDFSTSIDGPCGPTSGICKTKPGDKFGEHRFDLHQLKWAYYVVQQNSVSVFHRTTGRTFLALIPHTGAIQRTFYDLPHHSTTTTAVRAVAIKTHSSNVSNVNTKILEGKRYNNDDNDDDHNHSSAVSGVISLELDGMVTVRPLQNFATGTKILLPVIGLSDPEFFAKYSFLPDTVNIYNRIPLTIPGVLPENSAIHSCLKMYNNKDRHKRSRDCSGEAQGSALQWKIQTLSDWRKRMNLPPRLGELRLWAIRLHIYGDDDEEIKMMSSTNQLLAGLPVSTDEMSAEEQLLMLGMAKSSEDATAMITSGAGSKTSGKTSGSGSSVTFESGFESDKLERPPPQLYTAPDPEEDPEAKRAMENLASLAYQVGVNIASGNLFWNATQTVLNQTRDFFQYGVLPSGGLDALDDFLLKKLGLISHCGVSGDMAFRSYRQNLGAVSPDVSSDVSSDDREEGSCEDDLLHNNDNQDQNLQQSHQQGHTRRCRSNQFSQPNKNSSQSNSNNTKDNIKGDDSADFGPISKELMCAMRVHLLSENETHIFCPAEAKVWEHNCQEVEFDNFTAISLNNEKLVIQTFRSTANQMLAVFPTSLEADEGILSDWRKGRGEGGNRDEGTVKRSAVLLRYREKRLLHSVIEFLTGYEVAVMSGEVSFQLDVKRQQREEANRRLEEHKKFLAEVKDKASRSQPLASISVDLNGKSLNLTLSEGADLKQTVITFCKIHSVAMEYVDKLVDTLRSRVVNPPPLLLMMGVVTPYGTREILGIPQGTNSTVETGVFCARHRISEIDCDKLQERVRARLEPVSYVRRVLITLTANAPDARSLQLILREGEQHDILQFVTDFFLYYRMAPDSISTMVNEIQKRLPAIALQIPVNLNRQRCGTNLLHEVSLSPFPGHLAISVHARSLFRAPSATALNYFVFIFSVSDKLV